MIRKLLIAIALFSWCGLADAANVYIDPTCANNGDGTVGSPCAASGGAAGPRNTWVGVTWTAGNTYLGQGGTTETLTSYQVTGSGTAGNPITITSYGTGKFTFRATASYATAIVSRTYITWDGVIFNSTNTNCLYLTGVSNNIIVKNSKFIQCATLASGISIEGQSATANFDNITIDSNDFTDISGPAVRFQALNTNAQVHDAWSITNNNMTNVDNGASNAGAIYIGMDTGSSAQLTNTTISGNLIANVNDEEANPSHVIKMVRAAALSSQEVRYVGISITDNTIQDGGGGISVAHVGTTGQSRINLIARNHITNVSAPSGIIAFWSNGLYIANNVIDKIKTYGANLSLDGAGIDLDLGNTAAHIIGNVVTNCLGDPSHPSNSGQGIMNFGSSTSEFVGNVMRANRNGFAFGDESAGIPGSQLLKNNTIVQSINDGVSMVLTGAFAHTLQNNLIYANGGYGINNLDENDAVLTTNLIYANVLGTYNSQTAGSSDILQDPLLLSIIDLRLQPLSPARRAGVFYQSCQDVRGRICNSPPDIGAYQMTSGDPAITRLPRN